MKNLKLTLLATILSTAIISCQGPAGPAGQDGNANVVSDGYDVLSTAWDYDGTNKEWYVDVSDPDITPDIAANGMVEIFLEVNNNPTYQALPYTYVYNTAVSISNTFTFSPGQFELDETASTLTSNYAPTQNFTYKVVAISADGITKAKKQGIDLKNYSQVSTLTGAVKEHSVTIGKSNGSTR